MRRGGPAGDGGGREAAGRWRRWPGTTGSGATEPGGGQGRGRHKPLRFPHSRGRESLAPLFVSDSSRSCQNNRATPANGAILESGQRGRWPQNRIPPRCHPRQIPASPRPRRRPLRRPSPRLRRPAPSRPRRRPLRRTSPRRHRRSSPPLPRPSGRTAPPTSPRSSLPSSSASSAPATASAAPSSAVEAASDSLVSCQIVERRIRDDAALEEAKRKEQATNEEKSRQERAWREAEVRQKQAAKLAAEARKTAFEAAQKEAAEKEAANSREVAASQSGQNSQNNIADINVFSDKCALEAESRRHALVHNQVPENIHLSKEFGKYDRQIAKSISKPMPTTDSVRARASELIKALDGQDCSRPIACFIFANKIISIVRSRNTKDKTFGNLAFACGYVMLLVTNQVPDAMDYLLAEFNRICIYTVPKHLHALNAQARNRDYYRLIGYQEENRQLESTESHLTYVVAYVKLYAAMIQTEIKGVCHPHGLAEGWRWLAMFLNALPATTATAYALHAFLKMAGFALYKKYGSQFLKILDIISRCFLPALKHEGDKVQSEAVHNIKNYLNDKIYLQEPEGHYLVQQLLSKELFM